MLPSPSQKYLFISTIALVALLFFSILTISTKERWALGLFQAGLFSLAAIWAVSLVVRPCEVKGSPLVTLVAACSLWVWLQLIAGGTIYSLATLEAGLFWTANFVTLLVALQLFSRKNLREMFLRALALFGFAVAVVSVVQLFTSNGKIFWVIPTGYKDLVLGPFVYPNNYAAFIELVFPVVLLEGMRGRHRAPLFLAMAGALLASVIASGSRAGSILITIEMAAMPLIEWIQGRLSGRLLFNKLGKLVLLASAFTAVVGGGYMWKRFQERNPYELRHELLSSSVAMLRERPWNGFGMGTWPRVYPAFALFDDNTFVNHAHNDWAEWAGEGGLPFLACMLLIAGWALRQSFRFSWGLGVSSVFLHCLVDYPMQKPALAALVFALLGALGASAAQTKKPPLPEAFRF